MASGSRIEWTETTWNPVTGCTKISHGCKNCYADRMSRRLQAMGVAKYPRRLLGCGSPVGARRPAQVAKTPTGLRELNVGPLPQCRTDQIHRGGLRSHERGLAARLPGVDQAAVPRAPPQSRLRWTPNIWLGASVESELWLNRLDSLRETGARAKFLSLEPLLGPLRGLTLEGVDWVIAGGELGPGARPMHPDWVRGIRDNCVEHANPFFFKQWGGIFKKRTGRTLDGTVWDQFPEIRSA